MEEYITKDMDIVVAFEIWAEAAAVAGAILPQLIRKEMCLLWEEKGEHPPSVGDALGALGKASNAMAALGHYPPPRGCTVGFSGGRMDVVWESESHTLNVRICADTKGLLTGEAWIEIAYADSDSDRLRIVLEGEERQYKP